MARVAFVGGGSAKFVGKLVRDMLTYEELCDARISLMDVDPEDRLISTRTRIARRSVSGSNYGQNSSNTTTR